MNKEHPYIGICDFMSRDESLAMHDVFRHFRHTGVQLMIGTMTSYEVLRGLPSKYATIYPRPETLEDIFSITDEFIINCIHYADYQSRPSLAETLKRIMEHCGPHLHAIQLDMVWPDPAGLEILQAHTSMPIVLQINKRSMHECSDNPITVAKKVRKDYDGLITHVLLDCSMGKGVPIDVHFIEGYIECMKTYAGEVEIAVAGALGPKSVHVVAPLVEKYQVSIDAQSQLRKSGRVEDPIDWDIARQYIHKSIGLYL